MTHLKPPETKKVELDISTSEDSSIKALRDSTMELVAEQKKMIQSGLMNAQEVAHTKVVQGEVIEHE